MNPQHLIILAILIVSTCANELSYLPIRRFNISNHQIQPIQYLIEISPSHLHTSSATDGTSDGMIITTVDPVALERTLKAIISAGEIDFDRLKEAILTSNEAILSVATSQKYLSLILRESVEALSSAIDYNDRLRAYKTEMLPLLAAKLIEDAKIDAYFGRSHAPVNTVLMDLVYDIYRKDDGYRITTCSAVFDKAITKGSVSRYRHRIDCIEQPELSIGTILDYISRGICFETITEEIFVPQDVFGDHAKELPIGYKDDETFANMYSRPFEILNYNSSFAGTCANIASDILGNYYSHHLFAKRSDLKTCNDEPYLFPSSEVDVSGCRASSTGIGSFLSIGFSSMNFEKLINIIGPIHEDSRTVVNIRTNFTTELGSQREVKVMGPPPCARACCSGEYRRNPQNFVGAEVIFERSYTGLWFSIEDQRDSFRSITEFMKTDLPSKYESSSEDVYYRRIGNKLYLSKTINTLIPSKNQDIMECFEGELLSTNFTINKTPLIRIPVKLSYCRSGSRIISPSVKKIDEVYSIEKEAKEYLRMEYCPIDDDQCEFFQSFDCNMNGECTMNQNTRLYTSESFRCNSIIRANCNESVLCSGILDAEYVLLDSNTKELCSIKYNTTSLTVNNYNIAINSTEEIEQKIESLVDEQISIVEESLSRTIIEVRESSEKLKSYESAFKNITFDLNVTYYRVGELITGLRKDVDNLKDRMSIVETNIIKLNEKIDFVDKKVDAVNRKVDHISDRLDNGDFNIAGKIDIAKGFEDLGEGALDLIRGAISLPFKAGSFFDVVIKIVCYAAVVIFGLIVLYVVLQVIRCMLPLFKSWNHKRNLVEVKERVLKRSEKIATTPHEPRKDAIPMFGTLTRRKTQDEIEMHELSRSSVYFTVDNTVVGKPDKRFSVVELENLPTVRLLYLCDLLKKVSSSEGEYYLIRNSAPSEKPSVLKHYDLDSDTCKYIVFAYKFGGFRIHL